MKRLPIRVEYTGDRNTDQAQRNAGRVQQAVQVSRIGAGRLAFETDPKIATIAFTGGTAKRVLHGLDLAEGALPTGYVVVDQDAASTVYRTAWDNRSITLLFGTTCNARVWVFA